MNSWGYWPFLFPVTLSVSFCNCLLLWNERVMQASLTALGERSHQAPRVPLAGRFSRLFVSPGLHVEKKKFSSPVARHGPDSVFKLVRPVVSSISAPVTFSGNLGPCWGGRRRCYPRMRSLQPEAALVLILLGKWALSGSGDYNLALSLVSVNSNVF